MGNLTAALFAAVNVLVAALYVFFAQNLAFPRKRHRVVTEQAALVTVTVFLVLLGAMVGLFVLVWSVMPVIELVVFPPNLMSNWPSLEDPVVGIVDLVRTGAFISTIGPVGRTGGRTGEPNHRQPSDAVSGPALIRFIVDCFRIVPTPGLAHTGKSLQ